MGNAVGPGVALVWFCEHCDVFTAVRIINERTVPLIIGFVGFTRWLRTGRPPSSRGVLVTGLLLLVIPAALVFAADRTVAFPVLDAVYAALLVVGATAIRAVSADRPATA